MWDDFPAWVLAHLHRANFRSAFSAFSHGCAAIHSIAVGFHPIDFTRISDDVVDMKNMPQLLKQVFIVFIFIALVAVAGLGCHTANGFGQDMKDAGQGIKNGTQ
jgi:predicted small secreted protein